MQSVLEAEKFDQRYGLQLPGDSALAVIFGGFEETLALAGLEAQP